MLGRFSRILVVDGCAASRNATHRVIYTLGYSNIDYAPDTRAGLRLIGQNNYRMVLADWDKAPVNGMELLRQARFDRRSRFLPFLMSVAQLQKKFVEIVRDDGATLYVVKPFSPPHLAERMAQVEAAANRLKEAQAQVQAQTRTPAQASAGELAAARELGAVRVAGLWQFLRPDF